MSTDLDSIDEVVAVLDRELRAGAYAGMMVTMAFRPGEPSVFITGKAVFSRERREPRRGQTYQRLVLAEEWVSVAAARDRLHELLCGHGGVEGTPVPTRGRQFDAYRQVKGTWSPWGESVPAGAFAIDVRVDASRVEVDHQKPIVAVGHRPYPSEATAIRHWVHDSGHGNAVSDNKWCIVLPQATVLLRDVRLVGDVLRVSTDMLVEADDIELQVVAMTGLDNVGEAEAKPCVSGELDFRAPDTASRFDLYIVRRPHLLLQEWSFNRWEVTEVDAITRDARTDLRNGETERIEFKTWVDPQARPNHYDKWALLKTAVAFANGVGGRLYVGVDDEGVPVGFKGLLQAASPNAKKEDPKQWYTRWVRKLLREDTVPPVRAEMAWLEPETEPVLVITVEPGGQKPYATSKNDVYIRRGATSRKADPHTELPQLYEQGQRLPP